MVQLRPRHEAHRVDGLHQDLRPVLAIFAPVHLAQARERESRHRAEARARASSARGRSRGAIGRSLPATSTERRGRSFADMTVAGERLPHPAPVDADVEPPAAAAARRRQGNERCARPLGSGDLLRASGGGRKSTTMVEVGSSSDAARPQPRDGAVDVQKPSATRVRLRRRRVNDKRPARCLPAIRRSRSAVVAAPRRLDQAHQRMAAKRVIALPRPGPSCGCRGRACVRRASCRARRDCPRALPWRSPGRASPGRRPWPASTSSTPPSSAKGLAPNSSDGMVLDSLRSTGTGILVTADIASTGIRPTLASPGHRCDRRTCRSR